MKSPLRFKSTSSYQFKKKLGGGGSGDALLFSRQIDGLPAQEVVIKTLRSGAHAIEELINEGRKLASLRHPHILTTFGYEKLEKDSYGLVLEYVPGATLKNIVTHLRENLRSDLAASMIKTIAEALAAAHEQNIIHGDMSARNVLVSDQGHLKLADFGLSMRISDVESPLTQGRGSVDYLSPKRWQGGKASVAADIFALGILAFEVLTGCNPLQDKTKEAVKANLEFFLRERPWRAFGPWLDFFESAFNERVGEPQDLGGLIKKIPQSDADSRTIQNELGRVVKVAASQRPLALHRRVTSIIATQTCLFFNEKPLRWAWSCLHVATFLIALLLVVAPGATGTDRDMPGHLRASTLTITSQPWGEILIDGQSQGYTPVVNVIVRSGYHLFEWRSRDHARLLKTLQTYDNGNIAYQIIEVQGRPLKMAPIKPRLTRPI